MSRYILVIVFILSFVQSSFSQQYTIKGHLIGSKDRKPIEFATISLPDNQLWAITNEKGEFALKNVPSGKNLLTAYCLGYVKTTFEVDVHADISGLTLTLQEDNLTLNEVVVTARQKTSDLTTSYTLDRTTLDHAQILNITDIESLLPGGKSRSDLNLASSADRFSLRSTSSGEKGNPSFGTAVEIDGVRLQNNASPDETRGVDTRNISSVNIESVEVITGIPSVEYGDLTSGVVKINTRKGRSPLIVDLATKPNTKQVALSKGFALGPKAGILNLSAEHTKSVSDLASPHTSYDRNNLSLLYSTVFNNAANNPLTLTFGISGNVGGFDSKADPDQFADTYVKKRDNAIRSHFNLNWLLNKSWITNLELIGSVSYSDKLSKMNTNKNSSSSQAAIHSTEEGYFIATKYEENSDAPIILTPAGYWYQLAYHDSKPVNYSAKLKADWVRKFGTIVNKLLIGSEFNGSGNNGRGTYYDDMRYAPTWREYQYKDIPYMNNLALYAEDRISVPVNDISTLELTGGLRSDITFIKDSEYGTVGNVSPRFNAKYTFWKNSDRLFRDLGIYAGWGKSVKLPSFEVLYPSPSYSDKLAFAPGTLADGTTFYAYYTIPSKAIYNPNLKWQSSNQFEIGLEADIKGTKILISAFRNKIYNPYTATTVYTPYTYKLTDQKALDGSLIPSADRIYTIDQSMGIVTVSDKNGVLSDEQLVYSERNTFKSNTMYTNGSPVERKGIDWAVDFAQIPALRTTFRLDGNFYYYKGIDETTIAWMPSSAQNMADGNPYKYVGYYVGNSSTSISPSSATSTASITSSPSSGGASVANGSLSRQVNTNLTITTHIPKIRLILSLRLEASFYNYKRNLSEYSGGDRGFVLSDPEGYFGDDTNIYGGDRYVAVYPLYYTTWDDPNTKIPFAEAFADAKENNKALYDELAKLVVKSNTSYYFNPNKISAYYSANLSVTKEIGDFASISFFATNFFNNMSMVKSSWDGTESTLYNSSNIPKFYYGLSLRLKL